MMQGPYHGGLRHHLVVSGGGGTDTSLLVSVLPDQYCGALQSAQETRLRRHNYGYDQSGVIICGHAHHHRIVAISVLVTNMAVLGKDNRVSLWQLGSPRHELELPSVDCINIIRGPGDSVLITGACTGVRLHHHPIS